MTWTRARRPDYDFTKEPTETFEEAEERAKMPKCGMENCTIDPAVIHVHRPTPRPVGKPRGAY